MCMRTLSVVYFLIIYSGISHFTSIEKPKTRKPHEPVVSSYSKPKPVADSYKKKKLHLIWLEEKKDYQRFLE